MEVSLVKDQSISCESCCDNSDIRWACAVKSSFLATDDDPNWRVKMWQGRLTVGSEFFTVDSNETSGIEIVLFWHFSNLLANNSVDVDSINQSSLEMCL